ncbi:MAG: hypothetical protein BGO54_21835 [Sphingobacteriales bacterium 46-32]|nr:MAG: hypothetical protein BGO54_21835 [Sphingobacteriales bacterium 46-32]
MITVNPIYIDEVLGPLIGGADDEASIDDYGYYKSDIEEDVKSLAKDVLLPDFKKQKERLQDVTKNTLAYYLTYPGKVNFESIFNSLLLPIETPVNAQQFFQWIWEVFFEGESKDYIKKEFIVEDFNVNAPLELLKEKD